MTYTYAILDVSRATYDEVRRLLDSAGYQHVFDRDVIDMHGIALRAVGADAVLAFPKPEPHKKAKARAKRSEKVVESEVRSAVVDRDGYCRFYRLNDTARRHVAAKFTPCYGKSEWGHLPWKRRSRTRGMAPAVRHQTTGSAMFCKHHHEMVDSYEINVVALTKYGADGPLRFECGEHTYEEPA